MLLILVTTAATTTTSQIRGRKIDFKFGQGTTERWLCWYGALMGSQTQRRVEAYNVLEGSNVIGFIVMHKPEMY